MITNGYYVYKRWYLHFVNVIIIDLTCVNLVLQTTSFQGMVVTIIVQAKIVSYHD
jgi:hypothetical protein